MIFTLFRTEIGAFYIFYKEKAILAALYMSIVRDNGDGHRE